MRLPGCSGTSRQTCCLCSYQLPHLLSHFEAWHAFSSTREGSQGASECAHFRLAPISPVGQVRGGGLTPGFAPQTPREARTAVTVRPQPTWPRRPPRCCCWGLTTPSCSTAAGGQDRRMLQHHGGARGEERGPRPAPGPAPPLRRAAPLQPPCLPLPAGTLAQVVAGHCRAPELLGAVPHCALGPHSTACPAGWCRWQGRH